MECEESCEKYPKFQELQLPLSLTASLSWSSLHSSVCSIESPECLAISHWSALVRNQSSRSNVTTNYKRYLREIPFPLEQESPLQATNLSARKVTKWSLRSNQMTWDSGYSTAPAIVSKAERYSLNTDEHFSTAYRMYSSLKACTFGPICNTKNETWT